MSLDYHKPISRVATRPSHQLIRPGFLWTVILLLFNVLAARAAEVTLGLVDGITHTYAGNAGDVSSTHLVTRLGARPICKPGNEPCSYSYHLAAQSSTDSLLFTSADSVQAAGRLTFDFETSGAPAFDISIDITYRGIVAVAASGLFVNPAGPAVAAELKISSSALGGFAGILGGATIPNGGIVSSHIFDHGLSQTISGVPSGAGSLTLDLDLRCASNSSNGGECIAGLGQYSALLPFGLNTSANPGSSTYGAFVTITFSPRAAGVSGISGLVANIDDREVVIAVDGPSPKSIVSDPFGRYVAFDLLPGTYTVTPELTGHEFDPPSRTVSVAGATVAGVNFRACRVGAPLTGVMRDATGGQGLGDKPFTVDGTEYRTAPDGSFSVGDLGCGQHLLRVAPTTEYGGYHRTWNTFNSIRSDIFLTRESTVNGTESLSGMSGDPVNTATGNYVYQQRDLAMPGIGIPFQFDRAYNSREASRGATVFSSLGHGWTHSYQVRLAEETGGHVTITWGDGHTETHAADGHGGYIAQYGVFATLIRNADATFTLLRRDRSTYRYSPEHRLAAIVDRNGNRLALAYDSGRLSRVTDTAGRGIDLSYDGFGRLSQITDPIGRRVQYAYDAAGNLVAVTDPKGNRTHYIYDGSHQLLTIVDPRGHTIVSNTYDDAHRTVTYQTDAKGNPTRYAYQELDGVTTITDALGYVNTHHHDELLRLIKDVDAEGNALIYEYDERGNRTQVIDRNAHVTQYEYDAQGNVEKKTDPLGNVTTLTYDEQNNPLGRTDALGNRTTFGYDGNGNLIRTTDALGQVAEIVYLSNGLPESVKDPRGSVTRYGYDAAGNLTAVTDALGHVTRYTYDEAGRRRFAVDALNRTTRYDYDDNDNLIQVTDSAGKPVTYTYDTNDNRIWTRDRLGHVTRFQYDEKDLLIASTNALRQTESVRYDALDRRIAVKDRRGNITRFRYDALGRVVMTTDALGRTSRFSYDPNGNLLTVTDALGHATHYAYDALNRPVGLRDALGNTIKTKYDVLGRVTSSTDANNQSTRFKYDKLGRLIRVTDAENGTVRYAYDANGNRTVMTDPNGHTTRYTYDALNRLIRVTEPEGNITRYAYDAVGDLIRLTKPDGRIIQYGYDELHRLTNVTYPDATTVGVAYDANGNRRSLVDTLGTQRYTYDALDRMTSHADPFGKVVRYGYDANGNRISLTYPDGKIVTYAYDELNRLATVTDWLNRTTHYGYDAAGHLIRTTNANGTITGYAYDEANRLVGLRNRKSGGAVINAYRYVLDPVGNHLSEARIEPLPPIIPAEVVDDIHDRENRLLSSNGVPNRFDRNGNLTAKGTTSYTYDFEHRLIGSKTGATRTRYRYDGIGERYVRVRSGIETRFVLDTNTSLTDVLMETDADGKPLAYNVYGLGLIERILPDESVLQYHYDSRGSTIAVTDAAQKTVQRYAYDPFGRVVNSSGSLANPNGFLGQHGVLDEGENLTFVRARYYDAHQARFLTKDSLSSWEKDTHGLHRYTYAAPNPITFYDPSGNYSIGLFATGVVQVAAAGGGDFLSRALGAAATAASSGPLAAIPGAVSTYDGINEGSKSFLAGTHNIVNAFDRDSGNYWYDVKLAEDFEGEGILDETLYKDHPNIKAAIKAMVFANTILSLKDLITGLPRMAQIAENVSAWKSISSWKYLSYSKQLEYGLAASDVADVVGEFYRCVRFHECTIVEELNDFRESLVFPEIMDDLSARNSKTRTREKIAQ